MYRFLLRPRWLLLHLAVVSAIVLMVNLGLWQLHRHHERTAFNATVTNRLDLDSVPLNRLLSDIAAKKTNASQVEWQTVDMTGTYLVEESLTAINRSQDGIPGKDPLTPMRLEKGQLVLINRGFVPLVVDPPPPPQGMVHLQGRVRATEVHRTGQASNPSVGQLKEVFTIDLSRISQQMPDELEPIYIEVLSSLPKDAPGLSLIKAPVLTAGPHLSYTFQWFAFCLFVAGGWIIVVRRKALG